MPDLNRIYHPQSRERSPVTYNPGMVPDAAGARLGAGRPALAARLGGIENDARSRALRDRNRWGSIAEFVGRGREVGISYARAVERRDEADLNTLKAAYIQHMLAGEQEAWARKYQPGGSDGKNPINGPLVAIEELETKFSDNPALKGARESVKKYFGEWRAVQRSEYLAKGAKRQADAADEYRNNALMMLGQAKKAELMANYETFDDWFPKAREAKEWSLNLVKRELGIVEIDLDGRIRALRDPTETEKATLQSLEAQIYDGIKLDRAKYLAGIVADPETADEIAQSMIDWMQKSATGNASLTDDTEETVNMTPQGAAARQQIAVMVSRARAQRERNVERLDTETQKRLGEAASDLVGKTEAADPSEVFKFADDATAAAMNIRDESKRATALKRIDGAVGIVEFDNWAGDLKDALEAFDEGDAENGRELLNGVSYAIGTMRSESGKAMAQQALAGAFKGRREDIGRKVSEVLERGWYFDEEAGQWQSLTREQALDLFQTNIVFMDKDARDKARKALDKGRPRMTADSIAALNTFLGANQAQILFDWDKVGASENGDMAYAPKDDWGKRGTIDIWNGRRDMDVDRAMAKKIWTIAERWQDLMRSGAVKPDSKGKFPTLDQYLDQQLKDDAEWRNWRDATIAERVEKTMELLDTQVDSMFFATPNQ